MRKALSFAKTNPWYAAGAALFILIAVWFLFFRGGEAAQDTLVVEPKPFLQQVSVSGKVVAAQEVDLGFSQGGRVTRVYARVGQQVAQGTLLAEVENGDLRAAVSQRQAALENQEARLASIKAGTRPEEIAVAEASVNRDTLSLIDDIKDAYATADDAVRNTVDLFMSNPRVNPQLTFTVSDTQVRSSVEQKRLQAEGMLTRWQSDLVSLSASSDVSAAALQAKANLSQVSDLLAEANAALNRAISNPSTPQSTLDNYISAVAGARTSVNASTGSLTAGVAALDASKKNLTLKQAGSTSQDIAAQEAQVKAAQADVSNAYAQLQKTLIVAPFSGTVTVVDAKVGKIVSPNSPEVSMISAGTYQIESFVPEVNVALIRVGNNASTTLDAYGDNTYFGARVISVDPASQLRDGVSTYRTLLEFTSKDDRIKPGMTANVSITTLQKDNVLAVPQGIVSRKDGKAYVTVVVGEKTESREVTLGEVSSLGEVEILSGLSAGETVVLAQP